MLAEALAAEASKAAKHSKDPFADLGVKFVEARLPCTSLMPGAFSTALSEQGATLPC